MAQPEAKSVTNTLQTPFLNVSPRADWGTCSVEEIMTLIPHRYPMLLIDRLEKVMLGESAIGIKNVTMNEWFFTGHFPQKPVMPGVLIVEAMAQTAGALVMKTLQMSGQSPKDKLVYFMSVQDARFRKPVVPGDTLELIVHKEQHRGNVWKFSGKACVRDAVMAEAVYSAMIVDKEEAGKSSL